MKVYDFEEVLNDALKNEAVKAEYERLCSDYSLSADVVKLRNERKMTQKELARLVGTSQPAIARLESGLHENLSLSFLRRVGAALGVKAEVRFAAY